MRVGWRLSLEPCGDDLAWSLLRADQGTAAVAVAAGIHRGVTPWRRTVERLLPRASADHSPWDCGLVDPAVERAGSALLGLTLLPPQLREELVRDVAAHTVTVATRGWPAVIPWEALALDTHAHTRLVERAVVRSALPLRARPATAPAPAPRTDTGLATVDPGPVVGRGDVAPLYPGGIPEDFTEAMDATSTTRRPTGGGNTSGESLERDLRTRPWCRWLYVGHIRPGTAEEPASAALVLGSPTRPEFLTAADILANPARLPVPERVGLIGCGSADGRPLENAGLPLVMALAGARTITATRWILPTDRRPPVHVGTTRLAMAVLHAHHSPTVGTALRRWQCAEVEAWRVTGAPEHSPLLWSAVTTFEDDGGHDELG